MYYNKMPNVDAYLIFVCKFKGHNSYKLIIE